MRRIFWIFSVVAMLAGAGKASGQEMGLAVSLPAGITPRPGEWQMLTVQVGTLPAYAAEITLQDTRGGPAISRSLIAGSGEPVSLPLPLLDDATLTQGVWRVNVTVRTAKGALLREGQSGVPVAGRPNNHAALRLVTAEGERIRAQESGPWAEVATRSGDDAAVEWAEVPEREILDGPALTFAGFDCVVIPEPLRGRFGESRAQTLLAAGVQIALLGPVPAKGNLISWQAVRDQAGRTAWVSLGVPQKPAVIAPGLSDLAGWQNPAVAGARDVRIIWWLGPGAVVLAILAYELFRRRWAVLLVWLLAMAGLSLAAVAYVRQTGSLLVHDAAWEQGIMVDGRSPTIALHESLHLQSPLFARDMSITAGESEIVFPVAATTRAYWSWTGLTLHLGSGHEPMRLVGSLPARSVLAYESRSIVTCKSSSPEVLLSGGYVLLGNGSHAHSDSDGGVLFSRWADAQPTPTQDSWSAWYALRFRATQDYLLMPGSADHPVCVVDRGDSRVPPSAP